MWKCRACRKQFTVLVGTILHGTKISIRTWVLVILEMVASKNGVAAREIERKYDLTNKTAWFMLHRIREAMKRDPVAGLLAGTIVADETWIGGKPRNKHGARYGRQMVKSSVEDKTAVFSLVHKESGEVRSHVVADVTGHTLRKVMADHVAFVDSDLHTDTHRSYVPIGREFRSHESVNHFRAEYVRGDVSTNQAENYFSQLKRSLDGTHHHISVEHLPRYLAQFDFLRSTHKLDDSARLCVLVGQTGGRRLTYKPLTGAA